MERGERMFVVIWYPQGIYDARNPPHTPGLAQDTCNVTRHLYRSLNECKIKVIITPMHKVVVHWCGLAT